MNSHSELIILFFVLVVSIFSMFTVSKYHTSITGFEVSDVDLRASYNALEVPCQSDSECESTECGYSSDKQGNVCIPKHNRVSGLECSLNSDCQLGLGCIKGFRDNQGKKISLCQPEFKGFNQSCIKSSECRLLDKDNKIVSSDCLYHDDFKTKICTFGNKRLNNVICNSNSDCTVSLVCKSGFYDETNKPIGLCKPEFALLNEVCGGNVECDPSLKCLYHEDYKSKVCQVMTSRPKNVICNSNSDCAVSLVCKPGFYDETNKPIWICLPEFSGLNESCKKKDECAQEILGRGGKKESLQIDCLYHDLYKSKVCSPKRARSENIGCNTDFDCKPELKCRSGFYDDTRKPISLCKL